MRLKEKKLPKGLYIKRAHKIAAIQEIQSGYNRQLSESLKVNDLKKSKEIVCEILKITLEEPVPGSLEGISTAVNILVGGVGNSQDIVHALLDHSGKDYTTTQHCLNVMALALNYANSLNFGKQVKKVLALAALLHDVGKLRLSTNLIKSPRRLTDSEFETVKRHTTLGYDLLRSCKFANREIKETALEHHERLDGSGYPTGKTDITQFAQIIGIIDCYEALTQDDREYRKAVSPMRALAIISSEIMGPGKFSREVFKAFARSLTEIKAT
jgi:putative nucleotidyltransferase with HDIG domain